MGSAAEKDSKRDGTIVLSERQRVTSGRSKHGCLREEEKMRRSLWKKNTRRMCTRVAIRSACVSLGSRHSAVDGVSSKQRGWKKLRFVRSGGLGIKLCARLDCCFFFLQKHRVNRRRNLAYRRVQYTYMYTYTSRENVQYIWYGLESQCPKAARSRSRESVVVSLPPVSSTFCYIYINISSVK